jgi:hypothetical protein
MLGILNGTGNKNWGKDDTPKKGDAGSEKTGKKQLPKVPKKVKTPNLAKIKGLG